MKTPEEIKKGLECCTAPMLAHDSCPYKADRNPFEVICKDRVMDDALAYIRQLEAKLVNQATEYSQALKITTEQRDAAIADLKDALDRGDAASFCEYCRHNDDWGKCEHPCNPYSGETG